MYNIGEESIHFSTKNSISLIGGVGVVIQNRSQPLVKGYTLQVNLYFNQFDINVR